MIDWVVLILKGAHGIDGYQWNKFIKQNNVSFESIAIKINLAIVPKDCLN